jgi:hypothetical protein
MTQRTHFVVEGLVKASFEAIIGLLDFHTEIGDALFEFFIVEVPLDVFFDTFVL